MTYVSNTLIFVSMFNFLDSIMCVSLLQVCMASPFLLVMSDCVSSRLPRHLHFFHSSLPFLVILYSSVLSLLTFKFLS